MKTTSNRASTRPLFTMSKKRKRSNKSRYKHESTGEYCTCAAYVAEIMCRKNAENKNECSLPYKFWNKKPWDWTFKRQLIAANKRLKDGSISEEALVKAILSNDFKRICSLNHPKALGIIKRYQLLLNEQATSAKQNIEVTKNANHRKKKFGKKSLLNKMRELENGKEENPKDE